MPSLSVLRLAEVASSMVDATDEEIYRSIVGVFTEYPHLDADQLIAAIAEAPALTNDSRADAILAAAAEHFAFHKGISSPDWVHEPSRFLETSWFPVDLPSLHVRALVSSPASFRRRGIFIDRLDLDRV